ncbi:MAG: hypothetical protein M0R46_06630 [Candidatus Muirbacterium halophilum]|nr:hypothetical protein [Candidatus Muirbacterium halophilum]
MSIINREEANKYYKLINELVDEYIIKWKIRPSNLKKYLKPNSDRFNKFLQINQLHNIKGANIILTDIIEDRYNMEKDGVMTFENFKIFESEDFKITTINQCLYKGIEAATNQMEKVLADYYDVNLGDIDIIDPERHMFKLNNWENKNIGIIIYSEEDIQLIKSNVSELLFNELLNKNVELNTISIDLSDLIDKTNFNDKIEKILNKEKMINIISKCLNQFEFKNSFNNYYIWTLE